MVNKFSSASSSTLTPLLRSDSPLPIIRVLPQEYGIPTPPENLTPLPEALISPENYQDASTPAENPPAHDPHDEFAGRIFLHSDRLVLGNTIYRYGKRCVVEHTRPDGTTVIVKFSRWEWRGAIQRSEAYMTQYAASNNILAPKILGVYDVHGLDPTRGPVGRAIVMEKVPGETLSKAWHKLSDEAKRSIIEQLREQIHRMRLCTTPYIGRIGCLPTWNVFNIWQPHCLGPFQDHKEFDEWCLSRIRPKLFRSYLFDTWKYRRVLEKYRKESTPRRFVLTHGDLSPRNIMVQDGKITGIMDWQMSGFLPDWVEYANATVIAQGMEDWWIPVLREVIPPCSKELARLAFHIEEHPGYTYNHEQEFDVDD